MKGILPTSLTLVALVIAGGLTLLPRPAEAYMPGDAYVRAAAYVPGMGWLPKQESGMPVGGSDPTRRISAIRVNVETAGGAVYGRGYGICYSTKLANANWSSEVCNGATSGVASFSGGRWSAFEFGSPRR